MNDLISRQAAIDAVHHTIYEFFDVVEDDDESPITYKDTKLLELNKSICARVEDLPSAQQWHVIKKRPMTNDERVEWSERFGYDIEYEDAFIYSNLPDDGEEVLVSSRYGKVYVDKFCQDEGYFDGSGDMDGIVAWMPLPKPYKEENDGRFNQ